MPSDDLELHWTYMTNNGFGSVEINNLSQSKFLNGSKLLHQIILPTTTVSDTGNYTCIVKIPPNNASAF